MKCAKKKKKAVERKKKERKKDLTEPVLLEMDGCVEVEAAYYSLPPGWIGRSVKVQWDELHVRILHPNTNQLLREHLRQKRGGYRIREEDHPKKMPLSTAQLLRRAEHAGTQIGKLCQLIYQRQAETGIRRILGVLSLIKKYGAAAVEDACATALDIGVAEHRFVRRYLERRPHPQMFLRQIDPLIRQLTEYRDFINLKITGGTRMNLIELNRYLRQLRLGGIAAVLETRLQQAQAEPMAPIDFLSCLVSDELTRRGDRLLERRRKQAQFRDPQVTLDNFDFNFNKKMNRSLVFDLATATFIARREDALFLGPPGTGKSHLAQAIGQTVIGQGYRVIYREAHVLLEEIAEAALDGKRKEHMELLSTVPLLIIDDLGMRKLGPTAAEELLEIVMRRYERVSTLVTSNRPVEDWGKLLGDSAAVTAMLDRLLHHGHILKCGPRSWRTKSQVEPAAPEKQ